MRKPGRQSERFDNAFIPCYLTISLHLAQPLLLRDQPPEAEFTHGGSPKKMNPIARTHDLVIERDGVDLFIHDLQREKYILLNPVSAFVWKKCDGNRNAEDIAHELETEIGTKVSTSLINSTVDKLFSESLLESQPAFA